jgi:tetratricopeptide (TPR) repeat protein
VTELATAGHHHGHAVAIGRFDHLGVADRAAGLNDRAHAGSGGCSLDTHAEDTAARVLHAQALAASGNGDAAELELLDILESDVDSPLARLGLARLYLKANRIPDAIFHATEGTRAAPENAEIVGLLGTAHLADGDPESARAAFEREARLRPENPGPWTKLGELVLQLGRPDRAIPLLEKARDLGRDEWRPPYLLGLAFSAAGRPLDAVEAYRVVIARNERVVEAHNNLAWILADSDVDPVLAEVHARRAAELDPENASVLGTLGWALFKNRTYEEACDVLEKAVRLAPKDALKHELLAEAEFASGRRAEARRDAQTALELDPSFPRAAAARDLLQKLGP